jgi:hypothetical protein
MSKVIDFIEVLGADSRLCRADSEAIQNALEAAAIEPALRDAILDADQSRLEALLGVQTNVCCMVHAPEPEDDDEETDEPDPEEDDEDSKAQRSLSHRAVNSL